MVDRKLLGSTSGYGEAANTLIDQYESVSFADVHRDVLHLFPAEPTAILDIGAGSGRDAAALAAQGHRVVAAEPTPELRIAGQRLHTGENIEWVDDSLPEMQQLHKRDMRFRLVLLTAVWMHLDENQRPSAMARIAGMLAPGGRVLLSLRHGPVPDGRRMFNVSAQETIALALAHGLTALHHSKRTDPLGRAYVHWTNLGFQQGNSRPWQC
ncbi:class I SAM-dependent methyltransferase [Nocardia takedensis]